MNTTLQPRELQERLDRITTHWSIVFDAHGQTEEAKHPAKVELLHRYRGAVYRYLLSVVGDVDLAEELSQQFAVTLLEGAFHHADPSRGRFRDYVKAAVINSVRRHQKERATSPRELLDAPADRTIAGDDSGAKFSQEWRQEVMNLTWITLNQKRPVYHALLRLRIDEPTLTSRELAERYTTAYSKPMNAANVRKTLERAHAKFSDLLVEEVASLIEDANAEKLRNELKELDLLKYCRSGVERWSAGRE